MVKSNAFSFDEEDVKLSVRDLLARGLRLYDLDEDMKSLEVLEEDFYDKITFMTIPMVITTGVGLLRENISDSTNDPRKIEIQENKINYLESQGLTTDEEVLSHLKGPSSLGQLIVNSYHNFTEYKIEQEQKLEQLGKISEILSYADSSTPTKLLGKLLETRFGMEDVDDLLQTGNDIMGIENDISDEYLFQLRELGVKYLEQRALDIKEKTLALESHF